MSAPYARSVRLTPEHAEAAARLLEHSAGTCYCRYWHFQGDKNGWLARMFQEPEKNRAEFIAAAGSEQLQGVLALDSEGNAVGWVKISEQLSMRKLYEQRLYKNLPCFAGPRDAVYVVGCFVIDERFRRQGVARALLRFGISEAAREGARAIEAFPRGAADVSDAEQFTGPLSLFLSEGFQIVNDFAPYPVLRKQL